LGQNQRNEAEETALVSLSNNIVDAGDRKSLGVFARRVIDYLDIVEACPDFVFQSIVRVLSCGPLLFLGEYWDFILELGMSEFLFSDDQRTTLAKTILEKYASMHVDTHRMGALASVINLVGVGKSAQLFLKQYEYMRERDLPIDELVWELIPLSKDIAVPPDIRNSINQKIRDR